MWEVYYTMLTVWGFAGFCGGDISGGSDYFTGDVYNFCYPHNFSLNEGE